MHQTNLNIYFHSCSTQFFDCWQHPKWQIYTLSYTIPIKQVSLDNNFQELASTIPWPLYRFVICRIAKEQDTSFVFFSTSFFVEIDIDVDTVPPFSIFYSQNILWIYYVCTL